MLGTKNRKHQYDTVFERAITGKVAGHKDGKVLKGGVWWIFGVYVHVGIFFPSNDSSKNRQCIHCIPYQVADLQELS